MTRQYLYSFEIHLRYMFLTKLCYFRVSKVSLERVVIFMCVHQSRTQNLLKLLTAHARRSCAIRAHKGLGSRLCHGQYSYFLLYLYQHTACIDRFSAVSCRGVLTDSQRQLLFHKRVLKHVQIVSNLFFTNYFANIYQRASVSWL